MRILIAIALLLVCSFATAEEPARITLDGRVKRDLVWVGQKDELYFVQQDSPTLLAIYRMNLVEGKVGAATKLERFHPLANTSELEPAFSGDGRLCAFVQSRANLQLRLAIESVPAGTEAFVGPGGGFSGLRHPTVAPDGGRVVYSIPANGGQQLISVNAQAQDRRELTGTAGINNHPAYSPDGSRIVFSSSRDENFEIYVIQADGSDPQRLTHTPTMEMRPRWSPDGKRIAFVTNRDGNYEIYVMNADGSNPVNVTHHRESDDFPAWSADGKQLAWIALRAGQHDVYMMSVP